MTIKKKYLIYIIFTALIISCAVFYFRNTAPHEEAVFIQAEPIQTAYGWGYNILADKKVYIHQEFIPGIPGKHGFKTKEDALKIGNLVISRIKSNQMTTITQQDLEKLHIQP